MIEINYLMLFAMICLFLYNVYLLFMSKRSNNVDQALAKWKMSLILFIIALIIFFLYFGTMFNGFQQQITINFNNGTPTTIIKNTDYLDALTFYPLVQALLLFNFIFLVVEIVIEFRVFARRGRMIPRKNRGY